MSAAETTALREFLVSRDLACSGCGYNLRGTAGDSCPECGKPVDLEPLHLREFLSNRDIPCPGCGYNLRGLRDPVCPECRQPIRLAVELTEARLASLLTSVAFLFAGAGTAGALLLTVVAISIASGRIPTHNDETIVLIWLPLACLLTCGFFAAKLTRRKGRIWFRKLPNLARQRVVAAAVLLPSAWFAAFLILLLMVMR